MSPLGVNCTDPWLILNILIGWFFPKIAVYCTFSTYPERRIGLCRIFLLNSTHLIKLVVSVIKNQVRGDWLWRWIWMNSRCYEKVESWSWMAHLAAGVTARKCVIGVVGKRTMKSVLDVIGFWLIIRTCSVSNTPFPNPSWNLSGMGFFYPHTTDVIQWWGLTNFSFFGRVIIIVNHQGGVVP